MKERIKQLINTKYFHALMLLMIILIILFVFGVLSIKYSVEGETNLPFNLSKLIVISTAEGIDNGDLENKWNIQMNQNNDIYLYITKNDKYSETELIKKITVDNFDINNMNSIGNKKIFKPDSNDNTTTFKNINDNIVDKIEYLGDMTADIKNLKISNQGGLVIFRCSNLEISQYISNEEQEINYSELLKKLNVSNESLQFELKFDVTIELNSGKRYKSIIKLDLPIGNIVEEGTQSKEITDISNFVFKRVSNE